MSNIDKIKIYPRKDSEYKNIEDFDEINEGSILKEYELLKQENLIELETKKIYEKKVILKSLKSKILLKNENIPLKIVTLNQPLIDKINNSEDLIFLKGILKYDPILKIFVLICPKEIKIDYELDKWIKTLSSISFEERITEFISSLNLNKIKLLKKEIDIFLLRMVPLVQKNHLLIDFSKRNVLKTRGYMDLGYFIDNTFNYTRANIIYNNKSKNKGTIFKVFKDVCILDEFQFNDDMEIIATIQQYKNDNKIAIENLYYHLDTSIIILGNPKKNIDYVNIFTKKQNIFENTSICKENLSTGDALLSRVDGMVPSWGIRDILDEMLLEKNKKRIPRYIITSIFYQLREINLSDKINKIIIDFSLMPYGLDKRSESAIKNTFEALVKILLPELINSDEYKKFITELKYLFNIALGAKILVNNLIYNIKPEGIKMNFNFSTSYYYEDEYRDYIYIILPHRKIILNKIGKKYTVIKQPLDYIGISQNRAEIEIMKKLGVNFEGDEYNLKHEYIKISNIDVYFLFILFMKDHYDWKKLTSPKPLSLFPLIKKFKLSDLKNLNFKNLGSLKFNKTFLVKRFIAILLINVGINFYEEIRKIKKSNERWDNDIFFNYHIGEHEDKPKLSQNIKKILEEISFYRLELIENSKQ